MSYFYDVVLNHFLKIVRISFPVIFSPKHQHWILLFSITMALARIFAYKYPPQRLNVTQIGRSLDLVRFLTNFNPWPLTFNPDKSSKMPEIYVFLWSLECPKHAHLSLWKMSLKCKILIYYNYFNNYYKYANLINLFIFLFIFSYFFTWFTHQMTIVQIVLGFLISRN